MRRGMAAVVCAVCVGWAGLGWCVCGGWDGGHKPHERGGRGTELASNRVGCSTQQGGL